MNKQHINLQYDNSLSESLVIHTDFSKLKQILSNLIRNALKFTQSGSINYGYTLINTEANPIIQFYVKDTGIGIPQEKLEIIFEMFRQVEDSNIRKFGGTGIGLSITKKLVELLGGNIWVESTVGKGTTFYFTLPGAIQL
jgi:signal transduction histidine kinase